MLDLGDLGRFEADLKKSEDLRKKLDETLRRIAEEGKAKSDGEAVAAAAAELGYNTTVTDLERASAEAEDVDEAELESVAGGIPGGPEDEYGHEGWCLTAWHCYIATLHTASKSKSVACMTNYKCQLVTLNGY